MNTVRKEEPIRVVRMTATETNNRIEFLNADEFEEEIRMDEARRWIEKDIRRHKREKERREYRQALFLYKIIMRMFGCLLLFGSMKISEMIPESGGALLAIMFVPAIVMIICPDPDK